MPTNPVTYRVSPEVDAELKRLAKTHGGVDKALRVLFEWEDPDIRVAPATETEKMMRESVDNMVAGRSRSRRVSKRERVAQELAASDLSAQVVERDDIEYGHHETLPRGEHVANARTFRGPILRPSEKKK